MPVNTFVSDTGLATLPDIGSLAYNGAVFSALFKSNTSGESVKDAAGRTTMYTDLTINAEGIVTIGNDIDDTVDDTMAALILKLNQCGGALVYSGKGMGGELNVNVVGSVQDVAWGPKPEVLEFRPLGASRSAMIRWTVRTRIPQFAVAAAFLGAKLGDNAGTGPVIQFNEETVIGYDDEGYSNLSIKGTLEIPLTRTKISDRTVTQTVDDFRSRFMNQVANTIKLTEFRVTRREFNVSRDKRVMEWSFTAEELPPMGMPPGATNARGRMSVRPRTQGAGLCPWICSISCTYTIAKTKPRRLAWAAFVCLLKYRMEQSKFGNVAAVDALAKGQQQPNPQPNGPPDVPALLPKAQQQALLEFYAQQLKKQQQGQPKPELENAFLISLGFDEGLYLDSKTITFEASWLLVTVVDLILNATGVWRSAGIEAVQPGAAQPGVSADVSRSRWAASVKDIMGANSWLVNRIDPKADIIIDLGINP